MHHDVVHVKKSYLESMVKRNNELMEEVFELTSKKGFTVDFVNIDWFRNA